MSSPICRYATPVGTLTGFAYLVDQDEAAVQGYRLSSQTYGARFAGAPTLSAAAKLVATRRAMRGSPTMAAIPTTIARDYYLLDAGLDVAGVQAGRAAMRCSAPTRAWR